MENSATRTGVLYRPQSVDDNRALPPMARRIFTETFGHLFDAAAFDAFCDMAYGPSGSMADDLRDPTIAWCIAEHQGTLIGYAKLRPLVAPAPSPKADAMELQQIYVRSGWHGRGVAETLMNWAIAMTHEQGAPELYLTVFDHNVRAKRFYARHGFVEVGACTFQMGNQTYDDRIWRKSVGEVGLAARHASSVPEGV